MENGDHKYKSINGICTVGIRIKHIDASALASAAQHAAYHVPAGFSCMASLSLFSPTRCHTLSGPVQISGL